MDEETLQSIARYLADSLLYGRRYADCNVFAHAERLHNQLSGKLDGYHELLKGWDDSILPVQPHGDQPVPLGREYRRVRASVVAHILTKVKQSAEFRSLLCEVEAIMQQEPPQRIGESVRLGELLSFESVTEAAVHRGGPAPCGEVMSGSSAAPEATLNPPSPRPQPSDAVGWSWHPVPGVESEPDPAPEDANNSELLPNGMLVVGARTRGKKHKLEGTHCDDCYAWGSSGQWTIVAVADGAGSKRVSRVGARLSCERAVEFLAERLVSIGAVELPTTRSTWIEAIQRDSDGNFVSSVLREVQSHMVAALREGKTSVRTAYELRKDQGEWTRILERELELKDLRSTLLITLVHPIYFDGEERYLCMHLQVGDGAAVACYGSSSAGRFSFHFQPLAAPDSGPFSSETEFLVDFEDWGRAQMRVGVLPAPLKWLFCMTDGVDDVFEPRSGRGYSWLLGELLLNQVLGCHGDDTAEPLPELRARILGALDSAQQSRTVRLLKDPEPIRILDVGLFAHAMQTTVDELLADPAIFHQSVKIASPVCESQHASQRLLAWLDGKDVKGEFDDRTLVIVQPQRR